MKKKINKTTARLSAVNELDGIFARLIIKIYLIIDELVHNNKCFEEFCMLEINEKSNTATARQLFIDERTLLRRKKKYQNIIKIIYDNLSIFKELYHKDACDCGVINTQDLEEL